MADQYKAPLIQSNDNNNTGFNYYGAPQVLSQGVAPANQSTNGAQYNYYGAQQQAQQMNGSTQGYSFETNNNGNLNNPQPSAPPDPSEFNNNLSSFSQSNFNMEGYVWKHSNENSNLKIHSPEGYNHSEVTRALREDRDDNNNDEIHVTDHGPGMLKGCQNSPHLKSWFLTFGLWTLITIKLICVIFNDSFCHTNTSYFGDTTTSCSSICAFATENETAFWIVFAIVFILYVIECAVSSSRKYLSNTFEKDGMVSYIDNLKHDNIPRIWWRVECYHYETRYRTVTKTDANGNSHTETETYTERVTTWTAHETYRYRLCNDVSGDFSFETRNENEVIDHLILQLKLYKTFSFANAETAADYNYKAMLFRWYNNRDVHQDFHYGIEINGFKSSMLGELEPGNKPTCMSLNWFWIISMIGFSPCFRLWFSSLCHKKTFLINKQISI